MADVLPPNSPCDVFSTLRHQSPSRSSLRVETPPIYPTVSRTSSASSTSSTTSTSTATTESRRDSSSSRSSNSPPLQPSKLDAVDDNDYLTHATNTSLNEPTPDDDGIFFPSYDDSSAFAHDARHDMDLPASPVDFEANIDSVPHNDDDTSLINSLPNSPRLPAVVDDSAIQEEPTLQVDYLSHEWREEDIWSSWKHIVSRRSIYGQRSRLENASWRTWTKSKYNLKTVSPETLNWLKDCDVTWLYGPLQRGPVNRDTASEPASNLSKNNSFLNKKPCLKKRSVSEAMLLKSLSSSSLVRQAAEAVKAQRVYTQSGQSRSRPLLSSAIMASGGSCVPTSSASTAELTQSSTTTSSSGIQSPGATTRRHIRFDNKVEQCIAVEFKETTLDHHTAWMDEDEYSDDDLIMMKTKSHRKRASVASSGRSSFSSESKGIAMLPSTTLKYTAEEQLPVSSPCAWRPLKSSPSQETLRPARPSSNYLRDEADNDEVDWQPSGAYVSTRRNSAVPSVHEQDGVVEDDDSQRPMRRTPSGMFMPFDHEEDEKAPVTGLFGRVVDTINTARDIGHVIWNVGWRK